MRRSWIGFLDRPDRAHQGELFPLVDIGEEFHAFPAGPLAPGRNPLGDLNAETIELEPGADTQREFNLPGVSLVCDVQRRSLAHEDGPSPVRLQDGCLRLHALADRGLVEVFVDGGLLYLPLPRWKSPRAAARRTF